MNYWAVGTHEKINNNFLNKNSWEVGYSKNTKEGKKIRKWIKDRVNIGDLVALKTRNIKGKSLKIFAIGKVIKKFNDNSGFNVEWEKLSPPKITNSTYGQTSTIRQVSNPQAIKEIFGIDISSKTIKENKMKIKNIILYGPPGVGKTHNVNKLIKLIEEGKSDKEIFKAIKENENSDYTDIAEIRERVKFVTFHQSFGYEDFIEGFRPNEDGNIELVDGIFKNICMVAQKNLEDSQNEKSLDVENLLNDFAREVEAQEKFEIDDNLIIEVNKKSNGELKSFIAKGRIKEQSLTKDIILRDFQNYLDGKIVSYKDIKPTYESNSKYHGNAQYYFKLYNKIKDFLSSKEDYKIENIERKNYYLVIDEINRGNISKIFGELITLIEEDKRDKLEVILPYSKKPFKVPSNLYIIGTMNSTDKSIALIDIALRRRFTFLKMEAKEDLITYEKAKEKFVKLNELIKEHLGDDYKLGHSYFMNIENDEDLKFVLDYKIIPLLEEYYYGDERFKKAREYCELKLENRE